MRLVVGIPNLWQCTKQWQTWSKGLGQFKHKMLLELAVRFAAASMSVDSNYHACRQSMHNKAVLTLACELSKQALLGSLALTQAVGRTASGGGLVGAKDVFGLAHDAALLGCLCCCCCCRRLLLVLVALDALMEHGVGTCGSTKRQMHSKHGTR